MKTTTTTQNPFRYKEENPSQYWLAFQWLLDHRRSFRRHDFWNFVKSISNYNSANTITSNLLNSGRPSHDSNGNCVINGPTKPYTDDITWKVIFNKNDTITLKVKGKVDKSVVTFEKKEFTYIAHPHAVVDGLEENPNKKALRPEIIKAALSVLNGDIVYQGLPAEKCHFEHLLAKECARLNRKVAGYGFEANSDIHEEGHKNKPDFLDYQEGFWPSHTDGVNFYYFDSCGVPLPDRTKSIATTIKTAIDNNDKIVLFVTFKQDIRHIEYVNPSGSFSWKVNGKDDYAKYFMFLSDSPYKKFPYEGSQSDFTNIVLLRIYEDIKVLFGVGENCPDFASTMQLIFKKNYMGGKISTSNMVTFGIAINAKDKVGLSFTDIVQNAMDGKKIEFKENTVDSLTPA
jgi:hypothetical protein